MERDAPDAGAIFADRLNYLPIAVFGLWLAPILLLWVQIFWPHPPIDPPPAECPPAAWFVGALVLGAAALALSQLWHRPRPFEERLYRAIGVRGFRRYATNGDAIVLAVRRRYADFTVYRGDREKLLANTRLGEWSHLALFVLGLVTTLYVLVIGWYAWAIWTAVTNVIGNLYPILLQRYTRARLDRLRRLRR